MAVLEEMCKKHGEPMPESFRGPPQILVPSSPDKALSGRSNKTIQQGTPVLRPKRLSLSPKMAQLPVPQGEVQPFVVVANQDYLASDPDELSFAFGELILVNEDNGDHFRGRPLEGEVFTERKVSQRHVSLMAKRGSTYVRVDSLTQPGRKTSGGSSNSGLGTGGSPAGTGASGVRLRDVARGSRTHLQEAGRKVARASADLGRDSSAAPSPSAFRKKTVGERSSQRPSLKESGGHPANSEAVDHSQEVRLLVVFSFSISSADSVPFAKVILKQGWLRKIGGTRKTWKRRFFFLSESLLYYYESDKIVGKKPLGAVELSDATAVERMKKHDDGFQIPVGDRLWEFRADTVDEASSWIKAITGILAQKSPLVKRTSASVLSVEKVINPLFGSPQPARRMRSGSVAQPPSETEICKSPSMPEIGAASTPPPGDDSESISTVDESREEALDASLSRTYFYDL